MILPFSPTPQLSAATSTEISSLIQKYLSSNQFKMNTNKNT